MKNKWLMMTVMLLAMTVQLYADDVTYNYLVLSQQDGSKAVLNVSGLRIVFSEGKLVATNNDGSRSVALSDLSKMYFAQDAEGKVTGIETSTSDGVQQPVVAYTLSGVRLGRYDNMATARRSLPKGIYVMKQTNGKNMKITVK